MICQKSMMRFAPLLVLAAIFSHMSRIAPAQVPPVERQPRDSRTGDSNLDDLLRMLDARRTIAGAGGFQWNFEFEQFTVPMPSAENYALALEQRAADPLNGARKDEKTTYTGEVNWQSSNNFYLFSARYVDQWAGGAADYLGAREQIGFDGAAYWDILTAKPGTELPMEDFWRDFDPTIDWVPSGTISPEKPVGGRVEMLANRSGFVFRPGYMALPYHGVGGHEWGTSVEIAGFLRELDRAGRELTFQEDGNLIRVSFLVPDEGGHPEGRGTMTLTFNTDQLAAVERITFVSNGPGGTKLRNADYSVRNTEISPGVWFPQEIIWGDWMNPVVTRIQLSEVQQVDFFRTFDFQVQFPFRTNITDHRTRLFYIASNDVPDESRATKAYARMYVGEHSGALGDHSGALDVPAPRSSPFLWMLIIANVIAVFAGLILFRRKFAKRGSSGK